jgi:hypothetical protein
LRLKIEFKKGRGCNFLQFFWGNLVRAAFSFKKPWYGIEEDLGVQGEGKSLAVIESCYKRRQPLQKMICKKGLVRRWWAVQVSILLSQVSLARILAEALRKRRL